MLGKSKQVNFGVQKEDTADSIGIFVEQVPGIRYDPDAGLYRRAVPPYGLSTVHEEIINQIHDIEERIKAVERDFYGNANPRDFIRRLATLVKPLQEETDVMAISTRKDMENIIMAGKDRLADTKLDESVSRLEAYHKKLMFYLPKCLIMMQEVYALTRETEKYCQSFYDPTEMVELGTAKDYETLRKQLYQTNNESLKRLKNIWNRYDSSKGLELPTFSTPTSTIALECECTRQMFLLLFPEAGFTIQESLERLREWIRADKNYITYLEGDRIYLRESLSSLDKELVDLKQRFHNAVATCEVITEQQEDAKRNFGPGDVEQMIQKMYADDQSLRNKLREHMGYHHSLGIDRMAIKKRIRERPDISDTKENHEKISMLTGRLVVSDHESRTMKNSIKRIAQKLGVAVEYFERKSLLEEKLRNSLALRNQLESVIGSSQEKQNKMKAQIELVDVIVRTKAAPNAAYNIYYNLARKSTEKDPVVVACDVVSKEIRHEWPLLYRSLPFQGRGCEEVDFDVKEISEKSRITTAERANGALKRWRRYNSKASVGDIKRALHQMRRPKMWEDVRRAAKLDENVFEDEEEEDELKHVPPELRPFYIKIERFDSMRQRLAEEAERQRQKEELLKKYSSKKNPEESTKPAPAVKAT